MKCPFCAYVESKVIDTRQSDAGFIVKRRRECLSCRKRFTTYEKLEHMPIVVVKKDNTRQHFDRNKCLTGISRACVKRPISIEQIENMVDEIEIDIKNCLQKEIPTSMVGSIIMDKLKTLDEVAYVRFASVYKHFDSLEVFIKELNKLMEQ